MAWISIHQQIRGAKLRQLYKALKCSEAEAIGILSLLWLWGIDNASEDGEILNADPIDLANVISNSVSKTLKIERIIAVLIDQNWIEKSGDTYYFHDWDVWQKLLYQGRRDRERKTEWQRQQRRGKNVYEDGKVDVHRDIHEDRSPSPSPSPKP